MHKWYYESGIGENRAILVENGQISEIAIERSFGVFSGPKHGAIAEAKLQKKHRNGGFILFEDGSEAIIKKWPIGYTEGQSINVEIIRERLFERTREKLPITIATDKDIQNAPNLRKRIGASQFQVYDCKPHEGDIFAQHGWYEILDQVEQGIYSFSNGQLIIEQCSAMTLIDVDGDQDNLILAKAAAMTCAKAIRLFNLQSIVGVDFPTIESRKDRNQITDIFDDNMHNQYERTGVNGFGFMQILMKCYGPSLLELLNRDRVSNIALMALRRAELEAHQTTAFHMKISAHSEIIALLLRYDWMDMLAKRTGRNWSLVEKDYDDIMKVDIS